MKCYFSQILKYSVVLDTFELVLNQFSKHMQAVIFNIGFPDKSKSNHYQSYVFPKFHDKITQVLS